MKDDPFISICIPAFGRTNYLRRLLDSIEIQSFRDFEVVITDDSPNGEVQDLVTTHALGPMIRYFKNPKTLGSPENWNEGIRKSKADWIKIMHDDDWFAGPACLGSYAACVQKGTARFYFSAFSNFFPDGHSEETGINALQLKALKKLPETLLAANRIGPPSAVIFKKDISISFDNRMQWLVDIDFYIRYLNKYPTAEYIPENLVHIGISASQVTRRSFGNPEIEIPERFMLYEKSDGSSIRHLLVFDSWWRFLRNLSILDTSQIKNAGYKGEIPAFIPSMIKAQHKIPPALLKLGLFSKLFMLLHYILGPKTVVRQRSS